MSRFARGLFWGSVIGGLGGLFLAPRSGKETRQKIVDEIDDLTDLTMDVNDSLEQFKSSLEEVRITASTLIEPFVDGVQRDVDNFRFQADPRIEQMNEQLAKLQNDLPDFPEE
ncbi:YtxH domain-containing protein [Enterococcus rivorum]|uniref:YtxH domain-containing protein n=1 Tax=Enterococcus rivorum TaxID=762845 RepID=A0A1E5KZH6_9ENTE|nr:YtxH domain-containing protein [Enterococcus rivorum]MBP2099397.1 gas vesicle protein [Enterococcus rivorum]OEH83260.1 hypothetical protein BCR26_10685 [Enterococcus rivorum]